MLFNSPYYIFVFLPIVLVVYFFSIRYKLLIFGKSWLVLASLYFYGNYSYKHLFLIISSLLVNFALGASLQREESPDPETQYRNFRIRKVVLVGGIAFNLGLLGWFKYTDFLILSINDMLGVSMRLLDLTLP